MPQMLIAEFVGTFLLVFTVGCNVLSNASAFVGVSIGCVLMVIIYAFGAISGGNFNPAVSVMLGIIQSMGKDVKMPWGKVGAYCGVQFLGGICGGVAYLGLFGKSFNVGPAKGFGLVEAGLCELIYTFMLCFVVANVAAANAAAGKEYYGLAIGFVVIAGAYGAGAVSGGCFNPAVALGIDLSSFLLGFGYSMAYMAFELVGAALAALAFMVVRPKDFKEDAEEKPVSATLTAEFLGTFMLVFTVGLNVLAKSPAAAFSIAASLMCMIYALGDVSGANFNPAVTLAIFCKDAFSGSENMPAKTMAMYMPTQIAGGITAALMYVFIYHGKAFSLGAAPGYNWGQVIMAEFIFTFVLCLVVLCAAVSPVTGAGNATGLFFGLAIGSCVTVGGFAIGGISGGSLNPAVSWGIGVGSMMSYAHGGWIVKALVYTLVELAAGGAAAGLTMLTHGEAEKAAKEKVVA